MSRVYLRYGNNYQSVSFEFAAKALNEVGFRRDRESAFPVESLEAEYERIETLEITAEAEGNVQSETEQLLLDRLREQAEAAVESLPVGGIAIVVNERGGAISPNPDKRSATWWWRERTAFISRTMSNLPFASTFIDRRIEGRGRPARRRDTPERRAA